MSMTSIKSAMVCGLGLIVAGLLGLTSRPTGPGAVADGEVGRVYGGQAVSGSTPSLFKCRKWEEKTDAGCILPGCTKVKSYATNMAEEDPNGQKPKKTGWCYSDDTGDMCGNYYEKTDLIDCKKSSTSSTP